MMRALVWVAATLTAACAATAAEVKMVKHVGYGASFDEVWDATVAAVAETYPIVKVLDKAGHRIVTCWRPIDRDDGARNALPGSGWRLYRATIEISPQAPYRVAVTGRAAEYHPPVLRPVKDEDINDPYWRSGRSTRVLLDIHERLKAVAVQVPTEQASPPDSLAAENVTDTCVMRPEIMRIPTAGMVGIPIGTRGAMMAAE